MRKITIAIISLFMVLSFTAMASADQNDTTTTGGATVTINKSSTCPGPRLTFNPSPSTVMSFSTTATAFTIIAASSKTTKKNTGIEYGLVSGESAVYQRTQENPGEVTDAPTAGTLPSDFKDKAGNTAPAS